MTQTVPELGRLRWTSQDGFTSVVSIREISDGRIVVVYAGERRIALLSAQGRTLANIGRRGQDAGEFELPQSAMPLRADTTIVPDLMLRWYPVLAPNGTKEG